MANQNTPKVAIVYYAISDLLPAVYNPRKISNVDYTNLKISIEKFGIVDPIIVNCNPSREGVIIGGHQRYKIAVELGMDEVPCIEVNLTEQREKELNIRLNRNGGDFDSDKLTEGFDINDLLDWGFDRSELMDFDEVSHDSVGEDDEFTIPKMELQPNEHHDYIVLLFENVHDYMHALQKLGIKKVDSSTSEKKTKIGIGRVVNGVQAIKKLEKNG